MTSFENEFALRDVEADQGPDSGRKKDPFPASQTRTMTRTTNNMLPVSETNIRDICRAFGVIVVVLIAVGVVLGPFMAFYVLGRVYPDEWAFWAQSKGLRLFYLLVMVVLMIIASALIAYVCARPHDQLSWRKMWNWIKESICAKLGWAVVFILLCLATFLTAQLLLENRYNFLCVGHEYTFLANTNSKTFRWESNGTQIFNAKVEKTDFGTLRISTSPLFHRGEETSTSVELDHTGRSATGFYVSYDNALVIGESISTSDAWYETPVRVVNGKTAFLAAENPKDEETVKFCMDNYDASTTRAGTAIILIKLMQTCRTCMEPCLSECIQRTGDDTCAKYRPRTECVSRCREPNCIGFQMYDD